MSPIEDKTLKRNIHDLLVDSSTDVKANFVVLAGQDIGRKYQINKRNFHIGRAENSDIYIDDPDVSRVHARIEVRTEGVFLCDQSTNGTLVNGQIVREHLLADGDRIQLGGLTILKFNYLDEIEDTFNEQLYNAANKDFLTQIYNRKYFLDRLRMEFSYSKRHNVPLSLLIFDIDHFKLVNDRYGHLAGDYVLRELCVQVSSVKRQEDLFARFGGEEFVILLRGSEKDDAIQAAEKLRTRIKDIEFKFEDQAIPLTVSVGLATFGSTSYKTHETFLRAADAQLLKAKRAGRNQVHYAGEGSAED